MGKYLLITKSDVDRAERFFTGRGEYAMAIGRSLPVVRAFTSLVAGFMDVPPVQFGALSLAGTLVYASALTLAGYGAGGAWTKIEHYIALGGYVVVAVIVALFVGFVIYRLRELRKEAAETRENEGAPVA
ncbi:MAG: hypothetical protein ABJB47_07940 [Actinomycetota bacterium]